MKHLALALALALGLSTPVVAQEADPEVELFQPSFTVRVSSLLCDKRDDLLDILEGHRESWEAGIAILREKNAIEGFNGPICGGATGVFTFHGISNWVYDIHNSRGGYMNVAVIVVTYELRNQAVPGFLALPEEVLAQILLDNKGEQLDDTAL